MSAPRFARDRSAADALAAVESDVALARRLGVDGTPAVFLNGRRIRDIRASALAIVIEHVLAELAIGKRDAALFRFFLPIHNGPVLAIVGLGVAPVVVDLAGQGVVVQLDAQPRSGRNWDVALLDLERVLEITLSKR